MFNTARTPRQPAALHWLPPAPMNAVNPFLASRQQPLSRGPTSRVLISNTVHAKPGSSRRLLPSPTKPRIPTAFADNKHGFQVDWVEGNKNGSVAFVTEVTLI